MLLIEVQMNPHESSSLPIPHVGSVFAASTAPASQLPLRRSSERPPASNEPVQLRPVMPRGPRLCGAGPFLGGLDYSSTLFFHGVWRALAFRVGWLSPKWKWLRYHIYQDTPRGHQLFFFDDAKGS